jgi:hypothetical protein
MSDRYWTNVRVLVDSGQDERRPKHEISDAVVRLVRLAADEGESWATEVLDRWCREGAAADYTKVFKDMNTVTFIRANGRRARKTVAYSRPMRSKADGAIIGRQIQAWWGMSRVAIFELRNELVGQREALGDILSMIDRIVEAMDRHPECATAAEAWLADGHDLDEIDLGGAA